jgi:hypothetical protein
LLSLSPGSWRRTRWNLTVAHRSGRLEIAQHIANHQAPRTTKLYDRRQDEISPDEVGRIAI